MNISEDVFFNTSFLLANTGFTRPGEKKKKVKGGREEGRKKKKKNYGRVDCETIYLLFFSRLKDIVNC